MIEVSNDFIREINLDNRDFIYYLDFTLTDGTVLHLTNADLWSNGITIEDAVSEEFDLNIGSAIIGQLTVVLNNIDERFDQYDFQGASVVLRMGLELESTGTIESFNKGVYVVNEPMYDGSLLTLVCLDNLSRMDKSYASSTLKYPATIQKIVTEACKDCGITFASSWGDLPLGSLTIQTKPTDESVTYRDVIAWAAQICGCNARCNRFGRLEFTWYNRDELNIDEALIGDQATRVFLFADSEDIPEGWEELVETESGDGLLLEYIITNTLKSLYTINVAKTDTVITGVNIIVQNNDAEDTVALNEYMSGSDGYVITIENNEFITDDNAQQIADSLGAKLNGLAYRKANYTHIEYPTMEAGDVAFVYDGKGRLYRTLVSSTTFTAGDIQTTISAGASPVGNATSRYSESTKTFVRGKELVTQTYNTITNRIEEDYAALTERITNSSGLYTTEVSDGSGGTIFYLHDKQNLSDSRIVWKMTAEAWGVSTDGGQTYKYGMTVDGNVIANILSATGINADWISSGRIDSTNGRAYFDLTNGYLAIESEDHLSRIVLRGWAAAIFLQHRDSVGYNWDYSKEMGANTTDTYVIGEIYMTASNKSSMAFQSYRLGTYDDGRTVLYRDTSGNDCISLWSEDRLTRNDISAFGNSVYHRETLDGEWVLVGYARYDTANNYWYNKPQGQVT